MAYCFANAIKSVLRPHLKHNPVSLLPFRTMRDVIGGMPDPFPPVMPGNRANPEAALPLPNHEYFQGSYSSRYMRRQRVRTWDQLSFTIQAGGRYAVQHPSVSPMKEKGKNNWQFTGPDQRLSVREAARIQGFPDSHRLIYSYVHDGYKLVGNAVPVDLAYSFALAMKVSLRGATQTAVPTDAPSLPPALTFRDAVGDLPKRVEQAGESVSYATVPQNNFQKKMRGGATAVTEHSAPNHGAQVLDLMVFIPEGKGAHDPDVHATIPEHLRPGGFGNSYARISWHKPAPTITSNSGTPSSANCIHPTEPRALTIREAARCQSFPDTYRFIGTDGQKRLLIGNAVPPVLAEAVALALMMMLDGAAQRNTPTPTAQTVLKPNDHA